MPEGDTVHRIAAYLRARLAGARIETGRVSRRSDIVLTGRCVEDVFAHGKHLFFALDDGTLLRSHLGLRGSWHRYPVGRPWRRPAEEVSIEMRVGDQVYVCFGAAEVEHVRSGSVRHRQIATSLGPDLLAARIDFDVVLDRARRFLTPETPVVDLLLDQRIAAGIGNVYKSEILFVEGIHPCRRIGDLDDADILRLYETARGLLLENVGLGPRVTRLADEARTWRFPRRDGSDPARHDSAGARHWVYGRGGFPCFRCGGPIARALLGRAHRSTYWCEGCQGEPPA